MEKQNLSCTLYAPVRYKIWFWTTARCTQLCHLILHDSCFYLLGLNALPFDPVSNNNPLQFNSSNVPVVTECPSLENTTENGKKRKRTSLPPGTDISTSLPSWHSGQKGLCLSSFSTMLFFVVPRRPYMELLTLCCWLIECNLNATSIK